MDTPRIAHPFAIECTPNFPEILFKLKSSIAITTYQAGKLIFIGAKNDEELSQLPRNFNKAMGMSFRGEKLALATKDQMMIFKNSGELAATYPNAPNTYDALYMPRASYYTGIVDIHDVEWTKDGLIGVNTSFSCLVKLDDNFSFTPIWQPHFIDRIVSEDRCHLNGLAMKDGAPFVVSALGSSNTPQGWRENISSSGILMSVDKNEILVDGLGMPHSPMTEGSNIYFLQSANGKLSKYNFASNTLEIVFEHDKFVRGLDIIGDYAFVAHSKIRKNSSTFSQLKIAETSKTCGIEVIHLPTKAKVAALKYKSSVDEIYDLKILQNLVRPNILNTEKETHKMALDIPGKTFWANSNNSN